MDSKLSEIETMRQLNQIHDLMKADNQEIKRRNKGAISVNLDHNICKDYYENWDITKLYDMYTVQKAVNYQPLPKEEE
jgi:hypothetical protein